MRVVEESRFHSDQSIYADFIKLSHRTSKQEVGLDFLLPKVPVDGFVSTASLITMTCASGFLATFFSGMRRYNYGSVLPIMVVSFQIKNNNMTGRKTQCENMIGDSAR